MTLQKTLDFLKKKKIKWDGSSNLSSYTTIKVGGKAEICILPETREQLEAISIYLVSEGANFVIIGGGSNIAFEDHSPSLKVIVNRTGRIVKESKNSLYVDSGVRNSRLMGELINIEAGGLEFLAGIPGTIGGSAAVHAGAFGKSFKEVVISADIISSDGTGKTISSEEFEFEYRNSRFKYSTNEVILGLRLKITPSTKIEIKEKIFEYINYRIENHPPAGTFSSGCFFKNPKVEGQKRSAGKAIELSGLKGFSVKNLSVSKKHANFIVNSGTTTLPELKKFSEEVKRVVKTREGMDLEREIIFISAKGEKY